MQDESLQLCEINIMAASKTNVAGNEDLATARK